MEGYHYDEDQRRVRVVVEEETCRGVEVVVDRDRHNAEAEVSSLCHKVGHRNVVVVYSRGRSRRCCEAGVVLDGRYSHRSVHVVVVDDGLVHLRRVDGFLDQDAYHKVLIYPGNHTRSEGRYQLGLQQALVVAFDPLFASVDRTHESPPS